MGIEQAMLAEHPDGRISKSLIEPFPNPDDWQEDGMFRVYWDKEPERDKHYLIACDEAKDDFFKLGIQRTQAEVEAHAERLRNEAALPKLQAMSVNDFMDMMDSIKQPLPCPHNEIVLFRDECALCGKSGYEVFQETGKTFRMFIKESKERGTNGAI